MIPWDPSGVGASGTVSPTVPRAIVAAIRERGIDPVPLLTKLGLDESMFADVRARIPASAVSGLWHEAPRLLGDETFGLKLGRSSEALSLGAYMLRSCATFGEGLAALGKYFRIFNDVHGVTMEPRDDANIAMVLSTKDDPIPAPRHAVEFAFSWIVNMARQATERDDVAPTSIAFEHSAPSSTDEHARVFRCPVAFGRPHSAFVFPLFWLGLPHKTFDPHLKEILELEAQAALARVPERATLSVRVRDIVRPMLASDAAGLLDDVASRLHMSARTLQRYLKDEGTSFQKVLDELRCDVARHRLRDARASVSEVAHELGFADQSAFHKAFVRWTGMTPGEFRKGD